MKNKVFSLVAVVLFATSLMSVAPIISEDVESVDCSAAASGVQTKLQKKGYSHLTANDAANAAYDSCIENGGSMNGA